MTDEKNEKSNVLAVLFPELEVKLDNGVVIKQRPLALQDLPKVAKSFGRIMDLAGLGKPPSEIAICAVAEIVEMLHYCIDIPFSDIPASLAPDLIDNFLKQNITEEITGKWQALIANVAERMPDVGQGLPGAGVNVDDIKKAKKEDLTSLSPQA